MSREKERKKGGVSGEREREAKEKGGVRVNRERGRSVIGERETEESEWRKRKEECYWGGRGRVLIERKRGREE